MFFGRLSLSRAFSGVVVFVGWFLCLVFLCVCWCEYGVVLNLFCTSAFMPPFFSPILMQ